MKDRFITVVETATYALVLALPLALAAINIIGGARLVVPTVETFNATATKTGDATK